MIRVAALTSGRNVPSARFRIRQHIPGLFREGFYVEEYPSPIGKDLRLNPPLVRLSSGYVYLFYTGITIARLALRLPGVLRSRRASATWLNRELVNGLISYEHLLRRPLLLDVDDAIWHNRPYVKRIARECDVIIAGNGYIADWFKKYCSNVEIVPTAIDMKRFSSRNQQLGHDKVIIGWTGTQDNLHYLEMIQKPLASVMIKHHNCRLRVICNKEPRLPRLPVDRVEFVPWSEQAEVESLRDISIGIMPMPDDEWTRGKCSFKMLQYLSMAKPVVVSPVGTNYDILNQADLGLAARNESEWYECLDELILNESLRNNLGAAGQKVVSRCYSLEIIGSKLARIFCKYIG